MGTPAFMSPEQARGRWNEVAPRSGIWSLGATLFTLGTGQYVHEGLATLDGAETSRQASGTAYRRSGVLEPARPA